MKRVLALIMLMSFVTVQANAATNNSLKTAFDDLNYTLSVEWDQQDKDFYNAQVDGFQDKIESLKADGLSNQELVDFAISNTKNEKLAKDLKGLFGTIEANKLSETEARKLVIDTITKSYSVGASWTSDAAYIAVVALVLVIVIAAAISVPVTVTTGSYNCYDEYVCYDYYDSWGWYMYTDCYWETYCY